MRLPLHPPHHTPPLITRWVVLGWVCACLLLAPVGNLRHALTHLGEPPAASQDDAHPQDKQGHCDLCDLGDLLDAPLPSSFHWNAAPTAAPAPAFAAPTSAIAISGTWFQSRAPPIQG